MLTFSLALANTTTCVKVRRKGASGARATKSLATNISTSLGTDRIRTLSIATKMADRLCSGASITITTGRGRVITRKVRSARAGRTISRGAARSADVYKCGGLKVTRIRKDLGIQGGTSASDGIIKGVASGSTYRVISIGKS